MTFQYIRRRKHTLPRNGNPFTTQWELRGDTYKPASGIYNCKAVQWLEKHHPHDVEEFIYEVDRQGRFEHFKDFEYNAAMQITSFLAWDDTENPDKWNDYYHEAAGIGLYLDWDDNV